MILISNVSKNYLYNINRKLFKLLDLLKKCSRDPAQTQFHNFSDEQGLHHIRTMHKQILEDADMEIESFKKGLPPRVVKLTMGELKKLKSYDDIDAAVLQTMSDLNLTVKETIQKADEGKLLFGVVVVGSHLAISFLIYLCLTFSLFHHLKPSIYLSRTFPSSHLKAILQAKQATKVNWLPTQSQILVIIASFQRSRNCP